MLSFAGEDINTNQMVAAIVANLWSSFEDKGFFSSNFLLLFLVYVWTASEVSFCVEPGCETMLFDFEKGRIVATKTSEFVLCVYGIDTPFGMLKSKATSLSEYLREPLETVMASNK